MHVCMYGVCVYVCVCVCVCVHTHTRTHTHTHTHTHTLHNPTPAHQHEGIQCHTNAPCHRQEPGASGQLHLAQCTRRAVRKEARPQDLSAHQQRVWACVCVCARACVHSDAHDTRRRHTCCIPSQAARNVRSIGAQRGPRVLGRGTSENHAPCPASHASRISCRSARAAGSVAWTRSEKDRTWRLRTWPRAALLRRRLGASCEPQKRREGTGGGTAQARRAWLAAGGSGSSGHPRRLPQRPRRARSQRPHGAQQRASQHGEFVRAIEACNMTAPRYHMLDLALIPEDEYTPETRAEAWHARAVPAAAPFPRGSLAALAPLAFYPVQLERVLGYSLYFALNFVPMAAAAGSAAAFALKLRWIRPALVCSVTYVSVLYGLYVALCRARGWNKGQWSYAGRDARFARRNQYAIGEVCVCVCVCV